MLSKDPNPFVDVTEKVPDYDNCTAEVAGTSIQKMKTRGPELQIRDVKLSVDEKDLGKTLQAEIKLVPRAIRMNTSDGKTMRTYEFEVTGFRFI